MKKSVLALLLAAPLLGLAQQKKTEQNFSIQGKLGDIKTPAKVYLVYQYQGFHKDSATVTDNEFHLKGNVPYPMKAFLFLAQNGDNAYSRPNMDQVAIYLENGNILVNSKDSLKNAQVGGTQLNKDQQGYINAVGNIRDIQTGLMNEYRTTTDLKKQDSIKADYAQLDVLLQSSIAGFIKANPNSQVALNALRTNFRPSENVELAQSLYNSLSDSIKNVASALVYKDAIEKVFKVGVGSPAPDFAAKTQSGKESHLSDLKGKYVLLDFWASWCGPCRKESPNLVKSYDNFKNKNFTIMSFSLDENANEWQKAIDADHYSWLNVTHMDNEVGKVAKLYNVEAIPTNYLLDPTGKIIATNLRGEELDKKLKEILN